MEQVAVEKYIQIESKNRFSNENTKKGAVLQVAVTIQGKLTKTSIQELVRARTFLDRGTKVFSLAS